MSDLVACPTCQSTLRLPADAATVRCPKCKTTLQVIGDAPPAPPPPPKPLPFAPPQVAKPKPPPPKATAKPHKKTHRPEVVDEELEADEQKAKEAKAEAERKRQVRRELDDMDRAVEKEEDRYDEIDEQCGWGRNALKTLRWSLLGYIAGMAFGYMVMLGLVAIGWLFNDRQFMVGLGVLLSGFGLLVSVGSLLGTATGFVLAIRGPKQARHTAIIGVVMTGLQLVFLGGTAGRVFTEADRHANAHEANNGYPGMEIAYVLLGTGTNLQAVGDAPTRYGFQLYNPGSYQLPWLNVLCGVFEFTRLLLVCQLVQRYAELGKSERTALDCGKTVGRVFGVILIFALFRGAACVGFDWFQDGAMWFIGQLVHIALFEVAFLIIGVRLLTQFRVTGEVEEVLIADRVASTFDNFHEV